MNWTSTQVNTQTSFKRVFVMKTPEKLVHRSTSTTTKHTPTATAAASIVYFQYHFSGHFWYRENEICCARKFQDWCVFLSISYHLHGANGEKIVIAASDGNWSVAIAHVFCLFGASFDWASTFSFSCQTLSKKNELMELSVLLKTLWFSLGRTWVVFWKILLTNFSISLELNSVVAFIRTCSIGLKRFSVHFIPKAKPGPCNSKTNCFLSNEGSSYRCFQSLVTTNLTI